MVPSPFLKKIWQDAGTFISLVGRQISHFIFIISQLISTLHAGEKLLDAEDDVDAADARDGIVGGAGVGPDPLDSESDQALLRRLRQSQARQFTLHLETIPIKLFS